MGNRRPDMFSNDNSERSAPLYTNPPPVTPGTAQLVHNAPQAGPSGVYIAPSSYLVNPPSPNAAAHTAYQPRQRRAQTNGYVPTAVPVVNAAYSAYPFNMNVGGVVSPYGTSYNSYSRTVNQYQNAAVLAVAAHSRPAFESIESIVHSFNAISVMLQSTLTAMQLSFDSLLGVVESLSRLKMFMRKFYAVIMPLKQAQWFLTKIYAFIQLIRGREGRLSAKEKLWESLYPRVQGSKLVPPSDGPTWPYVLFSGLLIATPYFVFKLLGSRSVMPNPEDLPENQANSLLTDYSNLLSEPLGPIGSLVPLSDAPSGLDLCFRARYDWVGNSEFMMSVTRGKEYWTSKKRLAVTQKNGGWLFINNDLGQKGAIPIALFAEPPNFNRVRARNPSDVSRIMPQTIPTPILDEHNNIVDLPHPSVFTLDDDFDDDDFNESLL